MIARRRLFWLVAVLALACIQIVNSFPDTFRSHSGTVSVTYTHGVLRAAIPYRAPHAGAGQLTIELLDPEDHVVASSQQAVDARAGTGWWQGDTTPAKPLALEDLVWHRLRYRFTYAGGKATALEGTESISQILRMPVVHVLGQQSYISGGQAAVRVIVTDTKNEVIPGSSRVEISLIADGRKTASLFAGKLNERGTTEAQFRFPAGVVGSYALRYVVDTPIGSAESSEPVRLEDKVSILLTTEKPIYQPGQTIHVRALALDRSRHEATAGRPLTFELEDSRGNKVFKRVTKTSAYGLASAEFALADEVNLGTYHLRALMGAEPEPANTAEIALNVERYVLPKFKVAVEFTDKSKHGYRPGDHVTGTVRANYFFGKPVDGAEITVKASGMDVAQFDAGSQQGKTDADGTYKFDLRLPTYFAGHPLNQGAARVLVEATVKDGAGHSETRGEGVIVSESPLLITAVPEGGTLAPNLENQVFVLTSYADGAPAVTSLRVHAAGNADQNTSTDEGGVAVVRIKPGEGRESLEVEAKDKEGAHAKSSVVVEARPGEAQILLRTERAVYRAGDRIALRVFSTKRQGTAYVDIVKQGQTVLTRDLDIKDGQAELTLAATPDLAGTVDVHAYLFGADALPVGDHRLIFVQPADELKIEAAADAAVYKPGQEARVRFRVTNSRGEGVQAALGLQVVDEAVFALAEKQPGFAKVFFYLEQEAMKPRYEIHSIGMADVVEPPPPAQAAVHDRAARALFAATEMVSPHDRVEEFGRTMPQTKWNEYEGRYQTRFLTQLHQIAGNFAVDGGHGARDPWGTDLRIERVNWFANRAYEVRSAGPDKQFDTADDLAAYLQLQSRPKVGPRSEGPSHMNVAVEHDRGAFRAGAAIVGTVTDQEGGALADVAVTARLISSGKLCVTRGDANGRFSLSAVDAGDYEVTVTVASSTVSAKVSLRPRDRAIFSAMLRQAAETSVVVTEVAVPKRMRFGGNVEFMAFERAAAGGVIGGVVGGVPQATGAFAPAPPAPLALKAKAEIVDAARLQPAEPAAPRVRSYFPEALYINPQIITDPDGRASIVIPMADSITTWRMAMMASTAHGALGSGAGGLKVFQEFFVDLDMPVTLTQGDRVSIPVAVYNYSAGRGDVRLQLQPEDWYSLVDDVADKSLSVDAGRVGGSQFTFEARRIGKFKLTLAAKLNGNPADIVVREIEVIPNGHEQNIVYNGRLDTAVHQELTLQANAIPDASKLFVRLYPGPLSQVIEGMDSLLRMPNGCFEQTSSSTYPNVLALDYMKRTKKLTPEVHAKAEGFIANGYQRLLTFEVPGGGFSWFGSAPANQILTAYGLMEFYDMSHVHDVDARLIERTQQWLAAQQQADGNWKPDTAFINEGATNRFNLDVMRITAYIAWGLENTGYQGPAVEKARQYLEHHLNARGKADAYTLAVLANFAADYGKDREFTRQAMGMLLDARVEKDEQVWWTSEETGVYGGGVSASVETTALAVQALLKWGQASATAPKALRYIAAKKGAGGDWGSTQATIMALRALLLSTDKGAADVRGTVEITLDGKVARTLALTPENNDLLHQFVFPVDAKAAHTVGLRFDGKGGLAYQVVERYFEPWGENRISEPLSIDVTYDRKQLAENDIATAIATVRNNLHKTANMVMVDLGIPPGFDLLSEDLQAYQEKSAGQKSGRLEKFSLTATQAILYFDSIGAGDSLTVRFRLRARYPIKARTFQSRVYEYYDPEVGSVARPVALEVRRR